MFKFKKIGAISASALMIGMSAGVAAAANYPAPFVVGGTADVAVVYGTGSGVSVLDAIEAGNLQSNLQSFMGAGAGGTTTSTSGETISLDTSNTRIYLNTSLNTARSSLTSTDLPTVLADNTFSGDVDAKMTSTIKFFAGATAGGDNSGKVIFTKQPKSNDDPIVGISMGSAAGANQLYNATVTFKAVAFNHSDSEGETIRLFGSDFVVSTATDATDLVLFSSAEEVTLTKTGDSTPSATVSIGGKDYTVELLNGDSTSATVSINGESKDITEGTSKKIGGIDVAVKTVTSSNAAGITASLLVGSEKLTFTNGATVTKGSDNDPIDGTKAYIVSSDADGRPSAATELTVAVYRPSSSDDAILAGETFVDPVFGSFKIDFAGMSSNVGDAARDVIKVDNGGDDSMSVSFTDADGNAFSLDFAHNQSSQWKLGDDSNNTIYTVEMSNMSEDEYIVLGNEDYGHVLQATDIFNSSNGDHTKHRAKLQDIASNTIYETVFTSDTTGTVIIDGKTYTVTMNDAGGGTHRIQLKYPTSDSTASTGFVMYPTVKTQRGANIALYEPKILNLGTMQGTTSAAKTLHFPDGDGYTNVALQYVGGGKSGLWTIGGVHVNLTADAATDNYTAIAIGQIVYNFTGAGVLNQSKIFLTNSSTTTAADNIDNPGLIIFEEQDNKNNYEAVIVNLEDDPGGSSTNGVGFEEFLWTTPWYTASATLSSDSDITHAMDWWGVYAVTNADDSDQKTVTIDYPDNQVYAQLYVGETGSSVSTGTGSTGGASQLGDVLVKDSEVSSVSSKNLIVLGGSCINSVAADVLGGSLCGAGFTEKTGVGSGEFLIESFDRSGKVALLVAGYEVSDTVNAAKYLRTQAVNTAVGQKYKGTTATNAEMVTTAVA
jgi:hypothetical protein